MIECVPRSPFSWTFDLHGLAAGDGQVTFNAFSEQGTITLGTHPYDVEKRGPLSGRWRLLYHGAVIAEAAKPSAFARTFDITSARPPIVLQAAMPIGRVFEVISGGVPIGEIAPTAWLGRRAKIDCQPVVNEDILVFAFWLAALTWKRASQNSS